MCVLGASSKLLLPIFFALQFAKRLESRELSFITLEDNLCRRSHEIHIPRLYILTLGTNTNLSIPRRADEYAGSSNLLKCCLCTLFLQIRLYYTELLDWGIVQCCS